MRRSTKEQPTRIVDGTRFVMVTSFINLIALKLKIKSVVNLVFLGATFQDYIFGEADYDLCMLHVKATMDKIEDDGKDGSSDLSLGTLRYLVFSCTYGGRMEDEFDIRTLETFLNRYLTRSVQMTCIYVIFIQSITKY